MIPARGSIGACAWCLKALTPAQGHVQIHRDHRGGELRILWCWPCTETDPVLQALADNENLPAGAPAAAERFTDLHHQLHDRVLAAAGVAGLRGVFHVKRDLAPPLTLRKHTNRWALPTDRNLR